VRAVEVGVGHQDDLVIAQLGEVEIVAPMPVPSAVHQRCDLFGTQHLVRTREFDIEDLAPQRQHRLEFAVAALLGAAAGGIALADEELGFGGSRSWQSASLPGSEAMSSAPLRRSFARLSARLAGGGGFHHLADDDLGFGGMLLEPRGQCPR